ncbi:MAG: IPT/TIG domain-containing protein, partial [bacterium]
MPPTLSISPGWDHIGNISEGMASGGVVINIQGYGFNVSAADYICRFSLGHRQIESNGRATSSTQLQCKVPAWGSAYPAFNERVKVSLLKGDVPLDYTAGG